MKNSNELIESIHTTARTKSSLKRSKLFVLAVLAGAFVAFGSIFFSMITAYGGSAAVIKLLGGLVFSTGLILVVIAGAELFTGNNLLIIPLMNKKIYLKDLVKNWTIVYFGNFLGSILMATMMFLTGIYSDGNGEIGQRALEISLGKVSLDFSSLFFRGLLCNMLVCLGIWMALIAKSVTSKILAVLFPITAFVAIGFEHCVANMYFIPTGMIIKNYGSESFWSIIAMNSNAFDSLNISTFLIGNLLPVTLGNIAGGALFIGISYWYIHKED